MRVCPRVVSTPVGRDQYRAGEAVRCGVSMVTAALPTGALQQLQTASAPDIGIRVVFLIVNYIVLVNPLLVNIPI